MATVSTTTTLGVLGFILLTFMSISNGEILPQADFNLQGMSGKWYLIGFATNAPWFVARKNIMKMSTVQMTPMANGGLTIDHSSINADGSSFKITHNAKPSNMPGRFTFRSDRAEGDNDMRVVQVNYDEFALIHTIKTKSGAVTILNKLYGRTSDQSSDVLQRFRSWSLECGILPENIVIFPKND
ncbi:lipocalin-like [Alosa sapidissima]|uniref:lipocalin-like n=1 Tax=Alosa sapidissima TaxID=34773 RepID=UPI001C0A119A|nr:lipocalin-like [Alosa sapidissima]